jgi:hypothetical protein
LNRRRLGTFNILDGAGEDRANRQLDMLTAAELDLLFVTEAIGPEWAEGATLRRLYESRLGMWSRGRLEPGDGDGAGRFCLIFGSDRFRPGTYKPLRTRTRHWRGTGYLELATDGYPHTITAQADHGHTLDPDIRLSEARHTARCSIPLSAGPAIKAGDYNSVHGRPHGLEGLPEEDIEPDWRRLPIELRPYHWLLDPYGDPVLDADGHMVCDRRPSKVLQLAGFRDAVADLLPPEDRPTTGGHGPDDAPRRLDRIYVRGLTPIGCATLHQPELSDHGFVHADVDLDSGTPGLGPHRRKPDRAAPSREARAPHEPPVRRIATRGFRGSHPDRRNQPVEPQAYRHLPKGRGDEHRGTETRC